MIGAWLRHPDAVPVGGGESIDAPRGVLVHVEISSLDCVSACGHESLALTGAHGELLAWVAAGLLAAGAAALVVRSTSTRRRVGRTPG